MAWYWWLIILMYLTSVLVSAIEVFLSQGETWEDLLIILMIAVGWPFFLFMSLCEKRELDRRAKESTKKTIDSFFRWQKSRRV